MMLELTNHLGERVKTQLLENGMEIEAIATEATNPEKLAVVEKVRR